MLAYKVIKDIQNLQFCFIKRFRCRTFLERLCLAALWDNGVRYLFIQPFSCVSPVSCWHWDDVNTIRWSLFFAKDNKQTAIASNFWMKKLCNVKPKIKIQDYETTTIIMLSNMRIKFNKKTTMGNLAPALLDPQQIFYLSIHRVLGVGFYDCLMVKGQFCERNIFMTFSVNMRRTECLHECCCHLRHKWFFFSGFISRSFT
jgi:hypothetical protein